MNRLSFTEGLLGKSQTFWSELHFFLAAFDRVNVGENCMTQLQRVDIVRSIVDRKKELARVVFKEAGVGFPFLLGSTVMEVGLSRLEIFQTSQFTLDVMPLTITSCQGTLSRQAFILDDTVRHITTGSMLSRLPDVRRTSPRLS